MEVNSSIADTKDKKDEVPFNWAIPEYYILDKNLEFVGDPTGDPPKDWKKSKSIFPRRKKPITVSEEVYVTLLSYKLEKLVESSLNFINRSYTSVKGGGADITAVDQLWRVHLFEVKKKKCTLKDLRQLDRYLRDTSFEWREAYLKGKVDDKNFESIMKILTHGIYAANKRTETIGIKVVKKRFNKEIKPKTWKDYEKKAEFLCEYLKYNVEKIWGTSLSHEVSENTTKLITHFGEKKKRITHSYNESRLLDWYDARNRCVLWLVVPDFDKKVYDRVVEMRGDRVDVRLLKMEVRLSREAGQFFIKIQKENFPEREKTTYKLTKKFSDLKEKLSKEGQLTDDLLKQNKRNISVKYYQDRKGNTKREKIPFGHNLNKPVWIFRLKEKSKVIKSSRYSIHSIEL